ncbi:hypothetical protein ACFE04_015278 [Oxalis oulophora]
MALSKVFLAFVLSLLVCGAFGYTRESQKSVQAQQCRLQRIRTSRPSEKIEAEGGTIQLWDENEEQFQCAGVAAMKIKMNPKTLTQPKYHSSPRLVYVKKGMGVMGVMFAGCPASYHSSQQTTSFRGMQWQSRNDEHQKIHRVRQGDLIAIPAGAAYWCHNDGHEDLVTVSIFNLNSQDNQLSQTLTTFFLAGGVSRKEMLEAEMQRGSQRILRNVFNGFDAEMLADVFDVSTNVIRSMQKDTRGPIVNVGEEMRMIRPDEEVEREDEMPENGMEETYCNMKIKQNMDTRKESDVVVRRGGRMHLIDRQRLPILRFLGMSAERANLMPNAIIAPNWSMTNNRVVYVTRGSAHTQIVDNFGNTIMDETVKEGDMFVMPQFHAATAKAGSDGYEWVTFKMSSQPMKSSLIGYTSVLKAIPIDVLTNSYQKMSPREAQEIKWNRDQTMMFSPLRRT